MKTVYVLMGPKGSGKSFVGKLIEKRLSIKFLSVEPYFMELGNDPNVLDEDLFVSAWEKIEKDVEKHLETNESICFESLGVLTSFKDFLKRVENKYNTKLIRINASSDVCLKRTRTRNVNEHVPMSKETITHLNKMVLEEKYDYDLIIENENASEEEIETLLDNLFS